jgi:hypothetical protein
LLHRQLRLSVKIELYYTFIVIAFDTRINADYD